MWEALLLNAKLMIGVFNMCGGDIFGSIARLALASASFGTSELFGVGKKVGNMFSNRSEEHTSELQSL